MYYAFDTFRLSPYRAPETIFGARDYDPYALDLWSLGATLSELFTPLRFISNDTSEDEDLEDELDEDDQVITHHSSSLTPFMRVPMSTSERGTWVRTSLFDAERGSIGLAWSIFKIRGTPNDEIWPVRLCLCSSLLSGSDNSQTQAFKSLPDACKLTFFEATPVSLRRLLPNLPLPDRREDMSTTTMLQETGGVNHFPPSVPASCGLDFVHRLLVYPPEQRMKPSQALNHPWLTCEPILLPAEYPSSDSSAYPNSWRKPSNISSSRHGGRSLEDILLTFCTSVHQ